MNSNASNTPIAIGISQIFPCSYLDGQQEQLLVIQEETLDPILFERLLAIGFRRSGSAIYKPRCPRCSACQPIRLPIKEFTPSKRQKRTLAQNRDLTWRITSEHTEAQYALYEKYIRERHFDGPMFPPSKTQYEQFLFCYWLPPTFIEVYDGNRLVAVAVTDTLPNSLSAIYSYFDPDEERRSLGVLLILLQCRLAKMQGKDFLYLGYQIDANRKMSYKRLYRPYQILTPQGWEYSQVC
ncbi:arginyltransferase [Shewanella xiamenensis]|uniref:arginyltransferase n=1 Tax=Shewanella xiamenensis TaxID=332186 RepID=UPI0024A6CD1A|nr:arginyltransferase [Shewanella xiamenensis]MDI5835402.1 arginyltransferase [Shewanella xiamenensis]MDI5839924.1 arginyltransferase [Shewanella xiamenensis]MDI5842832.1 arginyltransferase [Shewanella xiamenensis]MDI5850713.1 arginyltransferase [Shewanella xiamenensis]MDI5854545.1 arginyltransferase [Shewanella xiamenensis]